MASGLQNSILIDLCLPFPETPDDVCLECYLFDRSQCARSQTGLEGQPCHCQSVQLSSFQNSANSKPDTICLPGSLCETDGTVWAACATANNEDDCAAMPQCNLRRAVEFPAVSMLCFDDDLWNQNWARFLRLLMILTLIFGVLVLVTQDTVGFLRKIS